ncbi:MAG: hypothetical protein OEY70_07830 [Acidimicrobiia bacterium]|nr:hypothetical protein [Acidimicrobiia bacterium]
MSDTYIGWDGKSYPWPPPDGWYHASDGRWWAPNTGPNPPPMAAPSRFEHTAPLDHTSQYPEHGHDDGGYEDHDPYAAQATELLSPATVATGSTATPSYFDNPADVPPTAPASQLPPPGPSGSPGSAGLVGPNFGNGDDDPYRYGVPAAAAGPAGDGGLGPKKLVIGVAAVLAVVAIGVSAFLLRGGDDTATDTNGASSTVPGATVATPATLPPAGTPVSAVDPDATTTVAPVDPAASSTLASGDAALVGSFRDLLVQQGLTSDKLTDTEIQSFAASFCVFAKSSDNGDEFNVFREQAISETQSSLDPASLNKVIDAAVITFCPDEATRLGITLG